jgi:hypothetical protein
VVLQWFVNDVEGRDKSSRPRPMRLVPSSFASRELSERSVLYYLLNRQWGSLQENLGWVKRYPDYMRARLGDPQGETARAAAAALEAFFDACQEAGVPVAVVLFPAMPPGQPYEFGYLHERVWERCRARNVPYVDLTARFQSVSDPKTLWASRLDSHPSGEANRIAAEALLEALRDAWLPAAPAPGGA